MKLLTVATPRRQADARSWSRGWEPRRRRRARTPSRASSRSRRRPSSAPSTRPTRSRALADARPRARDATCTSTAPGSPTPPPRSALPLRALTTDAGVDVLSFGGTKNGAAASARRSSSCAPSSASDFAVRPQAVDAARLEDALPRRPVRGAARRRPLAPQRRARQRDGRAAWPRRLGRSTASSSPTRSRPTASSRACRARRSSGLLRDASRRAPLLRLGRGRGHVVRWMCSWDTTEEDVDGLVSTLAAALS